MNLSMGTFRNKRFLPEMNISTEITNETHARETVEGRQTLDNGGKEVWRSPINQNVYDIQEIWIFQGQA